LYEEIQARARGITVPKLFGISLHEDFSENHVNGLLTFLAATAKGAEDGHRYEFAHGGETMAEAEFWEPKSIALRNLTLGTASDAEAVNITGLAAAQLRTSVRKAAAAFTAPANGKNINLVVAESDRHHDIDVCEACFGTEEELFSASGKHSWRRQADGVFAEAGIIERVAGLVVLRRPNSFKPITDYEALLLINEAHMSLIDQIVKIIPIATVMRYNMRLHRADPPGLPG
jgi:hypothetical protein